MIRRRFLVILTCLGLSGCFSATVDTERVDPDRPPSLVIHDVTLFDSVSRELVPHQTVVVRGQLIQEVGDVGEIEFPTESTLVDGSGKYLIPGLIDAHVHLTHVLCQAGMTGDEILPYFLANGVVAVRDTGDNIVGQKFVQRYASNHPQISPRVFLCSPLIGNAPPIHQDIGWTLTKPEQVPELVAHMKTWGVTSLKIYANCRPDVARKVIEEGHRQGFMVLGHLSSYPVEQAIADGIDSLEHIESVSDFLRASPRDRHSLDLSSKKAKRIVTQIGRSGVFVDPTLTVFWGMLFFVDVPEIVNHPDNTKMPKRLQDFWSKDRKTRLDNYSDSPLETRQTTFRKYQQLVSMLYQEGANILVGTDAPEPQVPPGYSLHQEMKLLVESGLPPEAVLQAATLTNARALKEADRLGSIEGGKLADMVLLEDDPLDDIGNTRRIQWVIKDGELLDPAVIAKSFPE